jgi:possible lantibiotic mersacidin modifying enzyme
MPSPERAREAVEILLRRLNDFNTGDEWRAQLTEHDSGEEHASGTWCSGSAGIALAFAALHLWMPELASRTDLDRAVQHAFRTGTRSNLTLCHGDFGTLDVLAWIADRIPDLPCAEAIRDAIENGYSASDIRAVLDDKSVRYSLTPSFMVGTSGVLSWLARRADNARPYSPLIPEPFEVR